MMQRVLGDLHRGQHRAVHILPEEFDVVLEAFEVLGRRDNFNNRLLFLATGGDLDELFLFVGRERVLDRFQRTGLIVLNHLFSV